MMTHTHPNRSTDSMLRRFTQAYGLDERSLASFRIAIGLIVFVDLIRRFQHSSAMYTDQGIFRRGFLLDSLSPDRWSLLFLNGSQEFVNLFFMASFAVAVALILGWKTRLMAVLLWVIIVSIQYRNTHLQNGADTLIRVTLFWAMFVPLGRCWSLDSYHRPTDRSVPGYSRLVVSVATFALILQNAIMYLVTASLKNGPRWHEDGSALYYALGARHITTGFGEWFFQHTPIWLLTAMTYGTLIAEFSLPVMLLLPLRSGWLRTIAVGIIFALHLGILSTMTVGFFPVISIAIGLVVLPAWFWDTAIVRAGEWLKAHNINIRLATLRDRLPALPPAAYTTNSDHREEQIAGAGDHRVLRFINRPSTQPQDVPRLLGNLACVVAILGVLSWNLQSVTAFEVPQPVRSAMISTGLYQSWSMFAPGPTVVTTWILVEGTLEDGETIDLLVPIIENDMSIQQPLVLDQRDDVSQQDKYWRKFFQSAKRDKDNLRQFAGYACRAWNAENSGEDRLVTVSMAEGFSKTLDDHERSKPVFDQMGSWKCG